MPTPISDAKCPTFCAFIPPKERVHFFLSFFLVFSSPLCCSTTSFFRLKRHQSCETGNMTTYFSYFFLSKLAFEDSSNSLKNTNRIFCCTLWQFPTSTKSRDSREFTDLHHVSRERGPNVLKCDDVKLFEKCKKSREKLNPVHRILSHFWPKRMSDIVLRKNSPIMRHFLSIFCPTVRQSSTVAVSIIGRWYVKYDYVRSLISVSVHQTR